MSYASRAPGSAAASGSVATSGWHSRARARKAHSIVASSAPRGTPRTAYRSFTGAFPRAIRRDDSGAGCNSHASKAELRILRLFSASARNPDGGSRVLDADDAPSAQLCARCLGCGGVRRNRLRPRPGTRSAAALADDDGAAAAAPATSASHGLDHPPAATASTGSDDGRLATTASATSGAPPAASPAWFAAATAWFATATVWFAAAAAAATITAASIRAFARAGHLHALGRLAASGRPRRDSDVARRRPVVDARRPAGAGRR